MLLTNKHYTPEAIEITRKITEQVQHRFNQWLISPKYSVNHDDVDLLLSLEGRYCEDVIFDEADRISRNQRILLLCEQERVTAKNEKIAAKQKTLKSVIDDVSSTAEDMLCAKFDSTLVSSLYTHLPDFSLFASSAFSPSLSFTKLNTLAESSRQLSSSLIEFVSNPEFSEKFGKKPRLISDPKVAIGLLGIENCRMLLPVIMAQSMLKWSDENTKHIAPKVWQHLVVTSSATRLRLQETVAQEEDVGILLGVLRTLPLFLICNHFTQVFEDALVTTMMKYREAIDQREKYYACSEVMPNLEFLSAVIQKSELKIAKKLVEHIDWGTDSSYIQQALLEDIDDIPVAERSVYGAALAQARSFSIYDSLESSQIFNMKHKPYWFANVQMSNSSISKVKAHTPGKLTLQM